jgi:hypothetical protein
MTALLWDNRRLWVLLKRLVRLERRRKLRCGVTRVAGGNCVRYAWGRGWRESGRPTLLGRRISFPMPASARGTNLKLAAHA